MAYQSEAEFEKDIIGILSKNYGWESEILEYKTEEELIQNWKQILFENNRSKDRLNDIPLTDSEMRQILEQIAALRTPVALNAFINGKSVAIKRDNPEDTLHFGKEVSLKIYDRQEIAAGQSRYQIAKQPKFKARRDVFPDRRGDFTLLINGMPLIHVELKRSGVSVAKACVQIEKYSHEKIFTGLFSLIQVFVAMNPEETVYFANPGPDGKFNSDYYFHWADFNNEPVNEWRKIAARLLSIPMAHELIGFYTVADDLEGVLKVMRSYQYYAVWAITNRVAKRDWGLLDMLGGYVWHTTGSGKTLTSFKSAQLISASDNADKVIFLVDRIELGTQSLMQYRGFADATESIQSTESTNILIAKLKSNDLADRLILTSIQKMSNIVEEGGYNEDDIAKINKKRLVIIIDEAHRDVFGKMFYAIKTTFPYCMVFGFTGTPIHEENQKKMNTTSDVFGNELHRYSIADGIRDKNVLGFDPVKVLTYRDNDLREAVALEKAKAKTKDEAIADPRKSKIYYHFADRAKVPMAGYFNDKNKYVKGIEDYVGYVQYSTEKHHLAVIDDILMNWTRLSRGGKFHAILATSSIAEAIDYYRLFKTKKHDLKITALFDPNLDTCGDVVNKEEGLAEIIEDFNSRYGQKFSITSHKLFKENISLRLAHKKAYRGIHKTPDEQIDLLIVVDQMLTGFDSKWINTLYADKELRYEMLIQAFSRTNRIFGEEKPFGNIRYYRKPHTMEKNIEAAFKLYSGDKPFGIFAQKLEQNIRKMNSAFEEIKEIFRSAKIENFEKLPQEKEEKAKFAGEFKEFNQFLEAAKIQGFSWDKQEYDFIDDAKQAYTVASSCDEQTYLILALRYKELAGDGGGGGSAADDVPYDIETYLTEINTSVIDSDYMNSRFKKYLKALYDGAEVEETLQELHRTFATLSQEEQKYANIFLHDVQMSNVVVDDENKTFRDYVTEYMTNAKDEKIHEVAECFGLNKELLRSFMSSYVTEANLNEFGRFDLLMNSVDSEKAMAYLEKIEQKPIKKFEVRMKVSNWLRKFIFSGGEE